jgi:hypothetical protein
MAQKIYAYLLVRETDKYWVINSWGFRTGDKDKYKYIQKECKRWFGSLESGKELIEKILLKKIKKDEITKAKVDKELFAAQASRDAILAGDADQASAHLLLKEAGLLRNI